MTPKPRSFTGPLRLGCRHRRRIAKFILFMVLAFIGSQALGSVGAQPVAATSSPISLVRGTSMYAVEQEQQGRSLYQTGHFEAALEVWQQAYQSYQTQGDTLGQARVLSNLSLGYQQLGRWPEAQQTITDSLSLLETGSDIDRSLLRLRVLAQVLNTQGSLQFELGHPEQALEVWQQAASVYTQANDKLGRIRSLSNQAQALQALGFYRRALETLTQMQEILRTEPDSQLKAAVLRNLGDSLRLAGMPAQAQEVLQESLAIAQQLKSGEEIGAGLLSLGHAAKAQGDRSDALAFYQQAETLPLLPHLRVQNQLAQLRLLIEMQQWQTIQRLWPEIQTQLTRLTPSRTTIYSWINFAHNLKQLKLAEVSAPEIAASAPDWNDIAQLLTSAIQQARQLGDQRAEVYALGHLGGIYEETQQWAIAEDLTRQALMLAQAINAPDIAYRWQWQLGRILKVQGNEAGATAAYTEAVNILQALRNDLAAVNSEVQFSFRESVEPIYRELVSLLLQPQGQAEVRQKNLVAARQVIESLRLAELENFFREACLDAQPTQIDDIDQQAAVIYPIILGDRLEIVLSLPGQPLRHYTTNIPRNQLESAIGQLRRTIVVRSRRDFFTPAQQLYDWLIRPAIPDLRRSDVTTLVFALDGALRNIPVAALHDGQRYLIEDYRVALVPGLQLINPRPLEQIKLRVLAVGLTKERQGFPPLNHVDQELKNIQAAVPSVKLVDRNFTSTDLAQKLQNSSFSVVHIATHGKFSSEAEETFILAWDGQINIHQLDELLQVRGTYQPNAIELLVLSACETAAGDQRATLGLAGIAVRAGARSTLASLWAVNDESTAELMQGFYRALTQTRLTKAATLQQAQLALLRDPQYQHPFYWAPYVLIGNWL